MHAFDLSRILRTALAVVLVAPAALVAQESEPASRPPASRPEGARTETRPQDDDLESELRELTRAPTAGAAGIRAATLYKRGPAARARLLEIAGGKDVTDAVFEGVVSAFDLERDESVLAVLFEGYGRGGPGRDQFVSFRFKEFDRRRSILDLVFKLLDAAEGADARRRLLRVLAEITDEPSERLRATRRLVEELAAATDAPAAADLAATLRQITFHEFPDAAQWREWFERFAATNPEGFAEAALYRSALKQKDGRFLQEVRRNIETAIAEKSAPVRWFDRATYPEAVIRRHAAERARELKGADPEVVRRTVDGLLALLKDESDPETAVIALVSAGELAERDPEASPRVGAAARARLGADAPEIVTAALRALQRVGGAEDRAVLESLYDGLAPKEEMRDAREQLLSTLYALNVGYATMTKALGDRAPRVRATAARVMAAAGKTAGANELAAALAAETAAEPQLAMVKSLQALKVWNDATLDALAGVAVRAGGGLARDNAVRTLIEASADPAFPPTAEDKVVAALADIAPTGNGAEEKRARLLEAFKEGAPVHVEVLARWLAAEGDLVAAKEVSARLARVGADRPERLEQAASALRTSGRKEVAAVLWRAALAAATAPAATASRRSRADALTTELARALLDEGGAESLAEAEDAASRALATRPEDARLLLLRASVRERRGKSAAAAEDLRAALKADGAVTGDERRDVERRLLLALLASGDATAAKAFLDGLPSGNRSRDFLVAAGLTEAAVGRRREAVQHLRNAVKAEGRTSSAAAELALAKLLVEGRSTAERTEAGRLYDALAGAPGRLPEGASLDALRTAVEADRAARAAVAALDAADDASRSARRREAAAAGEIVVPWLLDDLLDLAATGSAAVLAARLECLRDVRPDDEELKAIPTPAANAPRSEWTDAAGRLAAWWERARR